jgi:hypothetical protein
LEIHLRGKSLERIAQRVELAGCSSTSKSDSDHPEWRSSIPQVAGCSARAILADLEPSGGEIRR